MSMKAAAIAGAITVIAMVALLGNGVLYKTVKGCPPDSRIYLGTPEDRYKIIFFDSDGLDCVRDYCIQRGCCKNGEEPQAPVCCKYQECAVMPCCEHA